MIRQHGNYIYKFMDYVYNKSKTENNNQIQTKTDTQKCIIDIPLCDFEEYYYEFCSINENENKNDELTYTKIIDLLKNFDVILIIIYTHKTKNNNQTNTQTNTQTNRHHFNSPLSSPKLSSLSPVQKYINYDLLRIKKYLVD